MIDAKQVTSQRQHILYDAARVAKFDDQFFEPGYLQANGFLTGKATGRGQAFFFNYADQEWVLRHYQRGGAVAKLLGDRYLWTGLQRSRAWREWNLLAELFELGLPVPAPVAARVQSSGIMARADLITVKIPDSVSLALRLVEDALDQTAWQHIGSTVRRFHDADVWHADLNAHNILLADQKVYLIDFDRGYRRQPSNGWKSRNIQRLLRSLRKLASVQSHFHFTMTSWQALLAGYNN